MTNQIHIREDAEQALVALTRFVAVTLAIDEITAHKQVLEVAKMLIQFRRPELSALKNPSMPRECKGVASRKNAHALRLLINLAAAIDVTLATATQLARALYALGLTDHSDGRPTGDLLGGNRGGLGLLSYEAHGRVWYCLEAEEADMELEC